MRAPAPIADLPGSWPGTITEDPRGRLRIYLGKGHPAANTGGWTYLYRFIVWRETGHVLRADEHVHHECRGHDWRRCTDPDHLRVVTPQYHGRLHAFATLLFRVRDARGRWAPGMLPPPDGATYPIARDKAVMGRAAA